jgi:hypothetical protein
MTVLRKHLKDQEKDVARYFIDQVYGGPNKREQPVPTGGKTMKLVLFLPKRGSYRPPDRMVEADWEDLDDVTEAGGDVPPDPEAAT